MKKIIFIIIGVVSAVAVIVVTALLGISFKVKQIQGQANEE